MRTRESLPISLGPPAWQRPRRNGQVLYNGWHYCGGPWDFLGVDTAVPMCLPHLLCFLVCRIWLLSLFDFIEESRPQ